MPIKAGDFVQHQPAEVFSGVVTRFVANQTDGSVKALVEGLSPEGKTVARYLPVSQLVPGEGSLPLALAAKRPNLAKVGPVDRKLAS